MSNKMTSHFDAVAAKIAAAPPRPKVAAAKRILVVEDDMFLREFNARILTRSGYQVAAAEDGLAGWEALHEDRYDLLITDHNMPRLTGFDLAKRVRFARLPLPIILASGTLLDEELAKHPWVQFAATLLKPFLPQQLLTTVQEVLRVSDHYGYDSQGRLTEPDNPWVRRLTYRLGHNPE